MKKLNMKYILILAAILSFSFSCNKENKKAKTVDREQSIENVEQQTNNEIAVTPEITNVRPEREAENNKPKELEAGQPVSSAPSIKQPTKSNTPVKNTENMDNTVGQIQGGSINFPITHGNSWNYTAKNYNKGTLERTWDYTQKITKVEGPYVYINGQKEYKIEDGKIYKTFATRGGAETNGLYFFSPKSSKEQFKSLVGGDVIVDATVKKAKSSITVPAGTFSNCYVYTINSEIFYVEPGVGIVKKVNGTKGSLYYQVEELTKYSIKY